MTRTLIVLSLLMLPMMAIAAADSQDDPQAVVQDTIERMLQALKDSPAELEEDPHIIYGLVTDIMVPSFDFEKMSKLALGKNWRKADKLQRVRFTKQFRLLLIRTYSAAMLEYTDKEIRFLPFRDDVNTKKVRVVMEILQLGAPSITMALAMYLNKENVWKIYDVKIDGVSLITVYRSIFATRIHNDGMDKLIDSLAGKNERAKAV